MDVTNLFNWILDIPRVIASFGKWLTSPITFGFIPGQMWTISPLGLLSVGGVAVIIGLIGVHIARLFI